MTTVGLSELKDFQTVNEINNINLIITTIVRSRTENSPTLPL